MNKLALRKSAIFILVGLMPNLVFAQTCLVPKTQTWRWWDNLAFPEDSTSGWGSTPNTFSYIIDNKLTTYINTDLDVGQGPNGEGKVRFISYDAGPTGPDGWVRVWSGSYECTYLHPNTNNHWGDNFTCYYPALPATEARVTFNSNSAQMGGQSLGLNTLITLHEVGHVFGLAHMPPACTSTFMIEAPYVGQSESLNASEILWINSTY